MNGIRATREIQRTEGFTTTELQIRDDTEKGDNTSIAKAGKGIQRKATKLT